MKIEIVTANELNDTLAACMRNCWREVVVIPTAEVGNKDSLALKGMFLSDRNNRNAKTVEMFSHLNTGSNLCAGGIP